MNQRTQFRTGLLFSILGTLIMVGAFFWPQLWQIIEDKKSIATIVEIKGNAEKYSIHKSHSTLIKNKDKIRSFDSLLVGNKSELKVQFKQGAEIKILPGSMIQILGKPTLPQLLVKKGKLEVINSGSKGDLWISENGKTMKAQEYKTSELDETLDIDPSINQNNQAEINNVQSDLSLNASNNNLNPQNNISNTNNNNGISNNISEVLNRNSRTSLADAQNQVRLMISDRLARQKTRLYRCYSMLLQKKLEAKGKLSIHFTINNKGKVEEIEMSSSQFEDDTFHKCLVDIIKRTEFLPFEGRSVATLLPLKFEKGSLNK